DGGLKRRLELPATGWLRRYRVRVNGTPDDAALDRLRAGIEVAGEDGPETFAPMQVALDRQQGANAWLTVGLREGRNREIRRAMAALDLQVNRLIRVSYGPFQLGQLATGAVEEVKPRVLADQLGGLWDGPLAEARRDAGAGRDGDGKARGRNPRAAGDRLVQKGRGKPRTDKPEGKGGPRPKGGNDRAARPNRPRTAKPPVTRNDGRAPRGTDGDGGHPDRRGERAEAKATKAERKAAQRADSSVSLRKGGQRGRGVAKAKRPPPPKLRKPPDD
ncbi:MAG: RNA pseudouridine synthase, partial [Pseudomonadota bacterium]